MSDNRKHDDKNAYVLQVLGSVFSRTSILFTILYLSLLAFAGGFNLSAGMNFKESLLVLLSSFIISLSLEIFKIDSLNRFVKTAINYCVIVLSFFLVFVTAGKITSPTPARILVIVLLLTLLYFAIYTICLLIKRKILKTDSKAKTGTPRQTSLKASVSTSAKTNKTDIGSTHSDSDSENNSSETQYTNRFR
ncbi:MAG: hypothetical protein SOZ62_04505 [Eubacteriales bacterium]|nr:hypothetical protein [Eubacteriales bacterium]